MPSLRPSSAATISVALALVAREATADPPAVREPVRERQRDIRVSVDRGHATIVVRRSVHNYGPRSAELLLDLDSPATATITGLRLRGRDGWHTGRLHTGADAEDHYSELTHGDPDVPPIDRAAALLGMTRDAGPQLRLFPIASGSTRTVEYDVEIPATWSAGRWWIDLDNFVASPAVVQFAAVDIRDDLHIHSDDSWTDHDTNNSIAQGQRFQLPETSQTTISLRPYKTPAATLELAADSTGSGRAFAFWRLSLGRLSRLPAHARVVVAFDVSRSLAEGVAEAQRRAALAYLWHLRDPALGVRVTLLTFDRRVHALGETWTSVDTAIRTLERAAFTVANGSDVDLVLHRAAELLTGTPVGAPRRVLVLSDLATASSRRLAEHKSAAASTGAIVHLAQVEDRSPRLTRDDAHPWSPAAAPTHGVVWTVATHADPDPGDRAETRDLLGEWVRPRRLDDLHIELDGLRLDQPPRTVDEHEGDEAHVFTPRPATSVTVRALLWNTPFVRTARQDLELSRRWSGFMLVGDAKLSLAEHQHLGLRSGAVGLATSYLALEPGVAPSSVGRDHDSVDLSGLLGKGGGGGTGSGYGRGAGARFHGRTDRAAWFSHELAYLWHTCGGADEPITVELETTFDELVDIAVRTTHPLAACLHEAAWDLSLPPNEFTEPRMRWTISL